MCRYDSCCRPHQTYLQIFHNEGISRRLLNIHSLPVTLSSGKRWKEMSLLDEYRNSQGHSGTQQQNSAKQPLPMPAKPRSRWGFRWPWIESIVGNEMQKSCKKKLDTLIFFTIWPNLSGKLRTSHFHQSRSKGLIFIQWILFISIAFLTAIFA